ERALATAGSDELGNPLRLRRALDRGVRVIVAHCASLGTSRDLDDPGGREVRSFDLFLRLMDDPRYRGLVFGELSAVCFADRDPRVRPTLPEREDLCSRLVDGSDWPLPAIRAVESTRRLERAGFLTRAERRALDEVEEYDPLLFDLALKRSVHAPSTKKRFPP